MMSNMFKLNRKEANNWFSKKKYKKRVGVYSSIYDEKIENFFLDGVGSVLDILGNSPIKTNLDLKDLSYDWETIGQGICKAKEDFENENSNKLHFLLGK